MQKSFSQISRSFPMNAGNNQCFHTFTIVGLYLVAAGLHTEFTIHTANGSLSARVSISC